MMDLVLSLPSRALIEARSAAAGPGRFTDTRFPPEASRAAFEASCLILSGVILDTLTGTCANLTAVHGSLRVDF